MNLRSLDLNLLVVFDVIYRTKKISAAAENIGLSQPAASNALRRLREALNDPLFIRHHGGVIPTKKAEQLAPIIHEALNTIRTALAPSKSYDYANDTASFWIATEELGEIVLMPQLVIELAKVAPGIRIGVSPFMGEQAQHSMKFGHTDISLDYYALHHSAEFDSCFLFKEERVCVFRKEHPDFGQEITKDQYMNARHIILNQRTRGTTVVEAHLSAQGYKRNVAVQISNYHTVPLILEQTDMVAVMPTNVARHFANIYNLRYVKLPFTIEPLLFHIKWHRSKTADPRHSWLRNFIIERFKEK